MALKKVFRPRNIIILVIILAVVGYAAAQFLGLGKKAVEYDTVKAYRGDLIQTVEATGTVKALAEIDLAFESSGTLASTTVEVGDFVTRGQILAELDNKDLGYEVQQAKAALDLAKANYNLKVAGEAYQSINISKADVEKAKASVKNAEVNLEKAEMDYKNAQTTTQDQIDTAELAVAAALNTLTSKQIAYDNALASSDENLEDTYQDTVVVLGSALSAMATALSDIDNILGVDDYSANDDFEKYLSVLNSVALNEAIESYKLSKEKKSDSQEKINSLTINSDYNEILDAIDPAVDALNQIHQCLTDTRLVLDSTITGADLTLTALNTKKSIIDNDLTNVNTKLGSVLAQKQAIETLDINNENSVNAAEEALNSAQSSYDQAVKNLEAVQNTAQTTLDAYEAAADAAEASVEIQKAMLQSAEAALALKQADPRGVDLAPLAAQVDSAEAAYNLALNRLDKTQIKAPANGIITKINFDVGEQVTVNLASQGIAIVMLATDLFNVEVDIPETDITKITVGDSAEITLDAFGDDTIFYGEVIEIEPAETVIQDVVYYRVKVKIQFTTEQPVKNGMTANVIIKTDERKGVLIIPQRGVILKDGKRIVRILKNGKVEERGPSFGLRGDEGLIEVTSGIQENEEVVTAIRD